MSAPTSAGHAGRRRLGTISLLVAIARRDPARHIDSQRHPLLYTKVSRGHRLHASRDRAGIWFATLAGDRSRRTVSAADIHTALDTLEAAITPAD